MQSLVLVVLATLMVVACKGMPMQMIVNSRGQECLYDILNKG